MRDGINRSVPFLWFSRFLATMPIKRSVPFYCEQAMRLLLVGFFTLVVALSQFVSGPSARAGDSPAIAVNSVAITRDEWGVAHVHGKSHADAAFGMGYAQAEDHFWQLEDTCLRSIGRYAEVGGEAELSSDILNRSFEVVRRSQEDFPRLTPELQGMATAYAEGINRYLATHPETKPRRLSHFEPWYVVAMDRHMILYFIYGAAHVRRPGNRAAGEIARSGEPPAPGGRARELGRAGAGCLTLFGRCPGGDRFQCLGHLGKKNCLGEGDVVHQPASALVRHGAVL